MVRSSSEQDDPSLPRNAYEARYGRDITREESWAMLDGWCREFLGIGVEEFARRYRTGEYGDADYGKVSVLAFYLDFLEQNPPTAATRP
jgi:hypothetical protein